jgi:signal transduction histidine kinase
VWLSVETAAPAMRIRVHDTGIGIPEKDLDLVVKPFYRVHETASIAGSTGTGIGLALADRLVRAMHGQLEIANAPEQGTVVTIVLPIADREVVALRQPA